MSLPTRNFPARWQLVHSQRRCAEMRPVSPSATNASVSALVSMLRFHGLTADADFLGHELGDQPSAMEQVRFLRRAGLRARAVRVNASRLSRTPLPALAVLTDQSSVLLAKTSDTEVLLVDPETHRPSSSSRDAFLQQWTGILVLVAKRNQLPLGDRRFSLSWFLTALYKYRSILSEVLVATLFLQVLALATPLAFQVLVDKVLVNHGISTLDVIAVGLCLITVFEALLGGLRNYVFSHTTNRIDVELGASLFRHLLSLPLAYFQARRVGDSVAQIRELETVRQFLTGSALTLSMDLLFTVVFLAVMASYSLVLTGIVVASFPFFIAISAIATPMFRSRLSERFRRSSENQAFLVEAVSGIETLKAMAVEPQAQRRWEEQIAGYVGASQSVGTIGNVASQLIQSTSKLASAVTLWVGAHEVMAGDLTVGGLVAFNMLSGRVTQPVLRLAQMYQDFHQARLSVERLGDVLNTPAERHARSATSAGPLLGHVCFDHVSFRHRQDGPLVLDGITLDVQAGSVVGIVGPSGSGKSTLAKLLQRLYVPEAGRVLIDGIDLGTVDGGWLRRQIGVVLQDSVLFNLSVRTNIALADPGMPFERVVAAAQLAGAHDFILGLPDGYDTIVGERGGSLSGGQRQRVAIARALVGDPRILVFDEATSALDYESERAVQRNLKEICRGRTVFIIAHRLSAVRDADRIVTVEDGRLVEQGSHDELVVRGGRYARLHALQGGLQDAG